MRGGGVREEPLLPAASHYKDVDDEFLQRVTENTKRYIGIFAEAVDELMPEPTEAFAVDEDRDILMTHYEGADGGADGTDPLQRMPPEIKRFFEDVITSGAGDDAICLYAENKSSMCRLRGFRTD